MSDDAVSQAAVARNISTLRVFELALLWQEITPAHHLAEVYHGRWLKDGIIPGFVQNYLTQGAKPIFRNGEW